MTPTTCSHCSTPIPPSGFVGIDYQRRPLCSRCWVRDRGGLLRDNGLSNAAGLVVMYEALRVQPERDCQP